MVNPIAGPATRDRYDPRRLRARSVRCGQGSPGLTAQCACPRSPSRAHSRQSQDGNRAPAFSSCGLLLLPDRAPSRRRHRRSLGRGRCGPCRFCPSLQRLCPPKRGRRPMRSAMNLRRSVHSRGLWKPRIGGPSPVTPSLLTFLVKGVRFHARVRFVPVPDDQAGSCPPCRSARLTYRNMLATKLRAGRVIRSGRPMQPCGPPCQ